MRGPSLRMKTKLEYPRGGGGVTLIFSHIRRLGLFYWVQNSGFLYFWGVFR